MSQPRKYVPESADLKASRALEAATSWRTVREAESDPVCPECGGDRLYVVRGTGTVPVYVECGAWNCHWTQEPDSDLAIGAAVETYKRRNPPKEAA